MDYLQHVGIWIRAVLRKWHGWLAGSAAMGLVGLLQALKIWRDPSYKVYVILLCSGVLVSFFEAWEEEYVLNRNGPQIMLEWISKSSSRSRAGDVVRLMNCGRSHAINISIGNFSAPEIRWYEPICVQSLAPGSHAEDYAKFAVLKRPNLQEMGYMSVFLLEHELKNNHAPVSLEVRFSDMNRTRFTQTFYLQRTDTKDSEVTVSLGPLKIQRRA
jgi:hypothetical protein